MNSKELGKTSSAIRLAGVIDAALLLGFLIVGKHFIMIDAGIDYLLPYLILPLTLSLVCALVYRLISPSSRRQGGLFRDLGFVLLPLILIVILSVTWAGL
jgi:hypothetical protein